MLLTASRGIDRDSKVYGVRFRKAGLDLEGGAIVAGVEDGRFRGLVAEFIFLQFVLIAEPRKGRHCG